MEHFLHSVRVDCSLKDESAFDDSAYNPEGPDCNLKGLTVQRRIEGKRRVFHDLNEAHFNVVRIVKLNACKGLDLRGLGFELNECQLHGLWIIDN